MPSIYGQDEIIKLGSVENYLCAAITDGARQERIRSDYKKLFSSLNIRDANGNTILPNVNEIYSTSSNGALVFIEDPAVVLRVELKGAYERIDHYAILQPFGTLMGDELMIEVLPGIHNGVATLYRPIQLPVSSGSVNMENYPEHLRSIIESGKYPNLSYLLNETEAFWSSKTPDVDDISFKSANKLLYMASYRELYNELIKLDGNQLDALNCFIRKYDELEHGQAQTDDIRHAISNTYASEFGSVLKAKLVMELLNAGICLWDNGMINIGTIPRVGVVALDRNASNTILGYEKRSDYTSARNSIKRTHGHSSGFTEEEKEERMLRQRHLFEPLQKLFENCQASNTMPYFWSHLSNVQKLTAEFGDNDQFPVAGWPKNAFKPLARVVTPEIEFEPGFFSGALTALAKDVLSNIKKSSHYKSLAPNIKSDLRHWASGKVLPIPDTAGEVAGVLNSINSKPRGEGEPSPLGRFGQALINTLNKIHELKKVPIGEDGIPINKATLHEENSRNTIKFWMNACALEEKKLAEEALKLQEKQQSITHT